MKIRDRRAAVTGHEFPKANRRESGGEGGKEAWSRESEYFTPLVIVRPCSPGKQGSTLPRVPGSDGKRPAGPLPAAFSLGFEPVNENHTS